MRIETFQKIESKLFYVTMLPISIFVALALFLSEQLWQEHLFLTSAVFFASLVACFYLMSINIVEKPFNFLLEMYQDSKVYVIKIDRKYKTIHEFKIQLGEEKKRELNPEETHSEEDFGLSTAEMLNKKQSHISSMHIAFDLDGQRTNEHNYHKKLNAVEMQQASREILKPKRNLSRVFSQESPISKSTPSPQSNDIFNLYTFSNQKLQPQKPERKSFSLQNQEFDYINEFDRNEKSERLKQHLEKVVGSQKEGEMHVRREYEDKYGKYKKSLQEFSIDKEIIERFVSETKSILKQKIHEHLKKQFENLDSIESVLRKNFDANFRSYKQRSHEFISKSIYSFGSMQGFRVSSNLRYQEKSPFNKKENFGYQNLGKEMKFSEVLQECLNLMHTNYFEFDYIGEEGKINQVKTELKLLINQRIELDKFLYLKKPLDVGKNPSTNFKNVEKNYVSEFEEERYMVILKLETLANILSQRESAQQNMLTQFFSKAHSYSNQQIEQINDERNIEIVMNFFVKILRQKLNDSGNDDLIKIQLSRPNFQDHSANMIWVKKQTSVKSHYDVIYSLKKDQINGEKKDESEQQTENIQERDKNKKNHYICLHCCPGEKNLWTCMAFVRLLISKIGLKKEQYFMIKDKELRKDFKRVVELMK